VGANVSCRHGDPSIQRKKNWPESSASIKWAKRSRVLLVGEFSDVHLFYYSGLMYANPLWSALSIYEGVVITLITVFGLAKAYEAAGVTRTATSSFNHMLVCTRSITTILRRLAAVLGYHHYLSRIDQGALGEPSSIRHKSLANRWRFLWACSRFSLPLQFRALRFTGLRGYSVSFGHRPANRAFEGGRAEELRAGSRER